MGGVLSHDALHVTRGLRRLGGASRRMLTDCLPKCCVHFGRIARSVRRIARAAMANCEFHSLAGQGGQGETTRGEGMTRGE